MTEDVQQGDCQGCGRVKRLYETLIELSDYAQGIYDGIESLRISEQDMTLYDGMVDVLAILSRAGLEDL